MKIPQPINKMCRIMFNVGRNIEILKYEYGENIVKYTLYFLWQPRIKGYVIILIRHKCIKLA